MIQLSYFQKHGYKDQSNNLGQLKKFDILTIFEVLYLSSLEINIPIDTLPIYQTHQSQSSHTTFKISMSISLVYIFKYQIYLSIRIFFRVFRTFKRTVAFASLLSALSFGVDADSPSFSKKEQNANKQLKIKYKVIYI